MYQTKRNVVERRKKRKRDKESTQDETLNTYICVK